MKYMIIEKYKNGDAKKVYQRFFDKGRMAPEGLKYIESWIDEDLTRCYQLMETENIELLYEWIKNWQDIVDFEIVPVITSQEAQIKVMSNNQTPEIA